jgi:hypothetical protein
MMLLSLPAWKEGEFIYDAMKDVEEHCMKYGEPSRTVCLEVREKKIEEYERACREGLQLEDHAPEEQEAFERDVCDPLKGR